MVVTYHQWNLEQATQLILVLYARLGVYKPALVRDRAVAADQNVVRNGLAEDLDLEHIGDNLLCLAVDVGMYKRNVVVACNHVAERGQPLLYALDRNDVGQGVAEMLELLIGSG